MANIHLKENDFQKINKIANELIGDFRELSPDEQQEFLDDFKSSMDMKSESIKKILNRMYELLIAVTEVN